MSKPVPVSQAPRSKQKGRIAATPRQGGSGGHLLWSAPRRKRRKH
jgi:hypothetical protein